MPLNDKPTKEQKIKMLTNKTSNKTQLNVRKDLPMKKPKNLKQEDV